jgi:hypothetical protein
MRQDATRQDWENDHDEDRKRQARLHPQDGRLPLQSLHLQELRLLIRNGPRQRWRGSVSISVTSEKASFPKEFRT